MYTYHSGALAVSDFGVEPRDGVQDAAQAADAGGAGPREAHVRGQSARQVALDLLRVHLLHRVLAAL